jgi:hypothetical protein
MVGSGSLGLPTGVIGVAITWPLASPGAAELNSFGLNA